LNPLVARAWRISLRPRVRFGVVGAALLVLAAAWGLAQAPDPTTGRRVGRGYFELCRAELIGLLLIVGTSAAAAIASERQEGTWDALAASPLSDTDLVLGKAAGVLLPATLLASLLIPVHLACGVAWGAPWAMIVGVHAIFLGASLIAAGLSLLCSAVCHRVLHAVALAAAAIVLGWFATLDGLANAWTTTRFARIGQPLRLLDDLVTSSVSVEVAELRLIAFLLAAGLAGGLALLGTIRLARCSVQGRALALPGLFRARPGETDSVWDEPVYWRECRSRGARRTLRIGGLLILGLAIFLTFTNRDRAAGGFWAQIVGLSSNYTSMLIQAGMLLLCLRASVTVADERRRGMLAPLTLAGIGPARRHHLDYRYRDDNRRLRESPTVVGRRRGPGRRRGRILPGGLARPARLGLRPFAQHRAPRGTGPAVRLGFSGPDAPGDCQARLAPDVPGYPDPALAPDRRQCAYVSRDPHQACRAVRAQLPGELGGLLGRGDDACGSRRVDRYGFQGVARARTATEQIRRDSAQSGVTPQECLRAFATLMRLRDPHMHLLSRDRFG
jgi:hypothetical protein